MTEYLIFDTEQEAKARSAEAWEHHLGRKKHPEDVTEFLWSVDVGKDGRAAVLLDDDAQEKLTPQELENVVESLPASRGGNWEKPTGLP